MASLSLHIDTEEEEVVLVGDYGGPAGGGDDG